MLLSEKHSCYAFTVCSLSSKCFSSGLVPREARRGNSKKTNIESDWEDIFTDSNRKRNKDNTIPFISSNDRTEKEETSSKKLITSAVDFSASTADATCSASNDNFAADTHERKQESLQRTLPGGQSLLFEMARKLFAWDSSFNDGELQLEIAHHVAHFELYTSCSTSTLCRCTSLDKHYCLTFYKYLFQRL